MNKTDQGVRESLEVIPDRIQTLMSATFMNDVCALLRTGLEKSISVSENCNFA